MGGWAARKALRVVEHVEQGKAFPLIQPLLYRYLSWRGEVMIPALSSGHRAARSLSGY